MDKQIIINKQAIFLKFKWNIKNIVMVVIIDLEINQIFPLNNLYIVDMSNK